MPLYKNLISYTHKINTISAWNVAQQWNNAKKYRIRLFMGLCNDAMHTCILLCVVVNLSKSLQHIASCQTVSTIVCVSIDRDHAWRLLYVLSAPVQYVLSCSSLDVNDLTYVAWIYGRRIRMEPTKNGQDKSCENCVYWWKYDSQAVKVNKFIDYEQWRCVDKSTVKCWFCVAQVLFFNNDLTWILDNLF